MLATIQLQGIGHAPAKPAGDLVVGDRTLWNYGYIDTVDAIVKRTPRFVTVVLRNAEGRTFERRLKMTRLVGIAA